MDTRCSDTEPTFHCGITSSAFVPDRRDSLADNCVKFVVVLPWHDASTINLPPTLVSLFYTKGIELILTFMGPCIANLFSNITNKMQRYTVYLFISVKCSTCFRRFLRPSSGAENCIYSIGYFVKIYCYLSLSWKRWNSVPSLLSS